MNPLTGRPYSTRTVTKAIAWLIAHRLLMQTHQSHGGRGCGSAYFVRWSFGHSGLRARQTSQNLKTGYRSSSIEETQNYSFLRKTASGRPLSPKALRWVFARLREAPSQAFADHPPNVRSRLAMGLVVAARRAGDRGELRMGAQLGRFAEMVHISLLRQEPEDDCFDDDPQTPESNRAHAFGWAGQLVRDALDSLAAERVAVQEAPGTAGWSGRPRRTRGGSERRGIDETGRYRTGRRAR